MNGNQIHAPWTPEQVVALNHYQQSGVFHEFTCGHDPCRATLLATPQGWVCPQADHYHQTWAWAWMADIQSIQATQRLINAVFNPEKE